MLYQWRVQSEVLEINKDDFGGQSLSVERSPYFSAAAADTTSTVPNATNVEQVGTTVRILHRVTCPHILLLPLKLVVGR